MGNLVLYAIENGERRPLLSLDPDDHLAAAKFIARMANEMRACEMRGVALSDFRAVREERTADEGGKFVISAKFTEVDPHSGDDIGKALNTLDEIFAPAPAAPEKADPAVAKSAKLSR